MTWADNLRMFSFKIAISLDALRFPEGRVAQV